MLELLSDPQAWASLATLTILEIVLGIDNVIFIAILAAKLPPEQQARARTIGLALALIMRIALLASIAWIIGLKEPVIEIRGFAMSWRDIILLGGGLFLLAKATSEIHSMVEGIEHKAERTVHASFGMVIAQIAALDLVFSLDSILTAVGMSDHLPVMIAAVVIAIGVMMLAAAPVSEFVQRNPTVKMLALAFLILIAVALIAEGMHFHIPKGYLYFAVAFSLGVEVLNTLVRRRRRNKNGPRMPAA